ncbi:unnamed protein product [Phytomonas sp. Hart1]|nr:unnamed protein product [Phytomonas sp. Hart1]|eukprot:CCW68407.1 unnamed protein product [Phytomonas sp. isolate Hart1]
MSALLIQLQTILKSWDDIQSLSNEHSKTEDPFFETSSAIGNFVSFEKDPLHDDTHIGDSIIDEMHPQSSPVSLPMSIKISELIEKGGTSFSSYHNNRQVLCRLELARAALALFASNAGAYRPILTHLLRYVFECIDFLINNQALLTHPSPSDDTSAAAKGTLSSACGLGVDISKAEDVVASAHQKVQLVESRMSALIEESTAQRDRFKAQLLAQQQTQTKLELLLQNQIELNHLLTNHPLGHHDRGEPMLDPTGAANMNHRQAIYAQQLIARAEKESTIMELDTRVEQLTLERDNLQGKLLSLKKLNTNYARQAIELSARLNILRNHNIALSSDAVLYQHDKTRERQKSLKLQTDLMVARNMILVLLEVRRHDMFFRFSNPIANSNITKTDKNVEALGNKGSIEGALPPSRNDILDACTQLYTSSESPLNGGRRRKDDMSLTSDSVNLKSTLHANLDVPMCTTEDLFASVQDNMLRKQLQDIMLINDTSNGGAAKGALLKLLNLQWGGRTGSDKSPSHSQVPMLKDARFHCWVPPYGLNCNVPLHLCSRDCVMLIPFHPLVAECFVHELLSQRLEFFEFYVRAPLTLNSDSKGKHLTSSDNAAQNSDLEEVVLPAKESDKCNFYFPTTNPMLLPLDEFIVLFISMVWLNKNAVTVPEATHPQDIIEKDNPTSSILNQRMGKSVTIDASSKAIQFFHQYSSFHGFQAASEHTVFEKQSQLTVEGLKLAYGLDVVSRRQDCSFLTYAYGLVSRREISEIIFAVMRHERDVFLMLCETVEREHLSRRGTTHPAKHGSIKEPHHKPSLSDPPMIDPNLASSNGAMASDTQSSIQAIPHLVGCIPTLQLARILISIFPSYPISRIEEMVMAGIEDGADLVQAPHMLYYNVLLPERLLPGSVVKRTEMELSVFLSEGRFATMFYKSICDDALESMQLLDDTLQKFGATLAIQKRQMGLIDTLRNSTNFYSPDILVSAEQLTVFALKKLPAAEGRRWGPALTSVFTRCPLLHPALLASRASPILENETHDTESEIPMVPTSQSAHSGHEVFSNPSALPIKNSIANLNAFRGETGSVKLSEIMIYLRCHIVLRRGLYSKYVEAVQPAQVSQGTSIQDGTFQPVWTEAHLEYLKTLQDIWEHNVLKDESVLVTDAEFFWKLLLEVDPYRARVWTTADISHGSPLLRHEGILRSDRNNAD